jgi:hypothetical protein
MPDEFGQGSPVNDNDKDNQNGGGKEKESEGNNVNMQGGNARDLINMPGANVKDLVNMQGANAKELMINQGRLTIQHIHIESTQDRYRGKDKSEARKKQEDKYRVGTPDVAYDDDEVSEESVEGHPLPVTTKEFNDWFYKLSDYEQCFVLAMTAFYGTSVGKVRDAAEELYRPLRELERDEVKERLREAREPQQRLARTEFLKRLHIISSYSGGVDRLYWRDGDENGDSAFGTRLLLYIAKEGALKFGAQEGLKFQEQLRNWVKDDNKETSWNAARALGTFLCRQNKNRLFREVNDWAKSDKELDWHRAAWCLDGVYKIERVISNDADDDNVGDHVLTKLHDWVIDAREKEEVGINFGNTAAITYDFLARSAPDIGMNGLDSLLELPLSELKQDYQKIEILQEILEAVEFCYTDLAVNGRRVREVLLHLADYVKNACYERAYTGWGTREEREQRQLQRERRVVAAFDILYLIADASYPNEGNKCCVTYQLTERLAARPVFDSNGGRDLLLEGILIRDEKEWRTSISTLLCAAFVERKGQMALRLLRRWAELVMKDQSEQPDEVRRAYVRFMHELGIQVDAWCHQLQRMDVAVPPVTTTFKSKLETWKVPWNRQHDYIPLGLLAEEVLAGLPF